MKSIFYSKYGQATLFIALFAWPWVLVLLKKVDTSGLIDLTSINLLAILCSIAFYRIIKSKTTSVPFNAGVGLSLGVLLLQQWMIPAVGIFGKEGHPYDLAYSLLPLIGLLWGLLHSFSARSLKLASLLMSLFQVGIGLFFMVQQIQLPNEYESDRIVQIFFLNLLFAIFFGIGSLFFKEAEMYLHGKFESKVLLSDFVHLRTLTNNLRANRLSELEKMLFLLANWCVFGFLSYVFVMRQYGNPGVIIMMTLLPAIGVLIGYRQYAKANKRQFITHFIPLHFVLGYRFLVLTIFAFLLSSQLGTFIESVPARGFFNGGILMLMILGFYFRLAHHMRKLSMN